MNLKLPFPDRYTVLNSDSKRRNIRCILQYKGTAYKGWQVQPDVLTIQGVVEKCLYKMTREKIRVISSGRTDAGVHALMQVINFFTSVEIPSYGFLRGLNALLPEDIKVIYVDEVTHSFHARYCAKSKVYTYVLFNSKLPSPFWHEYSLRVFPELDLKAMKMAVSFLEGEHDFSSFMGAGSSVKTRTRHIYRIEIFTDGPFVFIEIEANGFLKHMVRNIVGTLVEIGHHKRRPEEMNRILMACDRSLAGPTAPAQGLFLKEVKY